MISKIYGLKIDLPMTGFRQFSAHVTKSHACRGFCMLSPLDTALTMLVAQKKGATRRAQSAVRATQHENSSF